MEAILALLIQAATLVPEVEAAIPAIQALISGQKVSAAQMVAIWQATAAIEALVAAKAAAIEAQGAAS